MAEARDDGKGWVVVTAAKKVASRPLSIGAISRATSIPVETLRTWERRYGFPKPIPRVGQGHRRYEHSVIEQLLLIRRLLAAAHRPSDVIALPRDELENLVRLSERSRGQSEIRPRVVPIALPSSAPGEGDDVAAVVESWLELTERTDGEALDRELVRAWDELGALRFLERRLGPFIVSVGDAWASGRISVYQEHYTTERIRDFLANRARQLARGAEGPRLVVAALSDELHTLGAHMARVVLSLDHFDVVFLGQQTPASEIARAVRLHGAIGVVLSLSAAAEPSRTRFELAELRRQVTADVAIAGGGSGMPADINGVLRLVTFGELRHWARRLPTRS